MRRRLASILVGISCALLGVATSHCDRIGPVSVVPPLDLCCWCLATHATPRGARCSRGSITDCVQDLERLDITGSETNIRCIRDVCGNECSMLASLLPKASVTRDCCDCLSSTRTGNEACYPGTSDECVTEIEEGEINKLLQGGNCMYTACGTACAALVGAPPDAGQPEPDAGTSSSSSSSGGTSTSSSSSGGTSSSGGSGGRGPHLPWDGGCPLSFPCY